MLLWVIRYYLFECGSKVQLFIYIPELFLFRNYKIFFHSYNIIYLKHKSFYILYHKNSSRTCTSNIQVLLHCQLVSVGWVLWMLQTWAFILIPKPLFKWDSLNQIIISNVQMEFFNILLTWLFKRRKFAILLYTYQNSNSTRLFKMNDIYRFQYFLNFYYIFKKITTYKWISRIQIIFEVPWICLNSAK